MGRPMSSDARGFTLIEVMVALLLMSILAMLSWRALDSMVRSRELLAAHGERFDGLRALFAQWDEDCRLMGPPDGWTTGLPLHLSQHRIDLIRDRIDALGVHHRVLVTYRWNGGQVERFESPAIAGRSELLRSWTALQQGDSLQTLYPVAPVVLMEQAADLGGRAILDGFDWTENNEQLGAELATPNAVGSALFLGAELWVSPRQGTVPYRKSCLTGQN
jgi:general secretion pathway protein J